jgi:hypothetical protein
MKWLLVIAGWLVVGLPGEAPPEAPAELVFYREKEFLSGAFPLKINDVKVADWGPGRYFRVQVPPGRLRLSTVSDPARERGAQGTPQLLELEAQAGKVYYIKAYLVVDIFTNELHLKLVSPAKAQAEMRGLKLDKNAKTSL